jgi:thymidylate synthase (FAD)
MDKIDVLDRGFVRLIDHMGSDLAVVRAARVSHDAAWRAGIDQGSDEKLIRYLWRNQHTTPFEAVEFQFEVEAPIFVLRQWHRHRTWTYNEVSARYTELPEEFYIPDPSTIGVQAAKNKQSREFVDNDSFLRNRHAQRLLYVTACKTGFDSYRRLLECGWPRELARGALPLSTYSHMFAKVDLHNLFHFLTLRMHKNAQYEIRVYAEAILQLIKPIVPVCAAAWEEQQTS